MKALKWLFVGSMLLNLYWWIVSPTGPVDTYWHRGALDAIFAWCLWHLDRKLA